MTSTSRSRHASETVGRLAHDARVVIVPWLLARFLVIGALMVAREVADTMTLTSRPVALDQGLLGWDAAFYADIAHGGYDAVTESGLRFFPFVPLIGRALGLLPGVDTDLGVLVVANACALGFGVLLHRLVVIETGDRGLARRAVWVAYLVPIAFTQVMGYAESTLLVLGATVFLAMRTDRWWLVAIAGYCAGLTRPPGVLLALPVLVVVVREGVARRSAWAVVARLSALAAPALGLVTYLLWVRDRTGDLFFAIDAYTEEGLRGETVDPVTNLGGVAADLLGGRGSGLAFVVAVVLVVLLVRLWSLLPREYFAYALVVFLVALTADNLDPLARIGMSAFPFAIAGASFLARPAVERTVLVASAGGLVGVSILAFTGALVP